MNRCIIANVIKAEALVLLGAEERIEARVETVGIEDRWAVVEYS